jgi:hypothetical protein
LVLSRTLILSGRGNRHEGSNQNDSKHRRRKPPDARGTNCNRCTNYDKKSNKHKYPGSLIGYWECKFPVLV